MAFTPSVKNFWNLCSHPGASSVPPPCLSIFLNIWPQGFYKVRVLRVKRRSTGSRLSSTSCLPKIGFRPVGQWKHFLFPSSFSQHSVTRISTIVKILKIWSKIFCNKDTINCILLYEFSLFNKYLALFMYFSPQIFTKNFNNFQKRSGHTILKTLYVSGIFSHIYN